MREPLSNTTESNIIIRKRIYLTVRQHLSNTTESNISENKNALSSVESRVFVDTICSEEANRARAFVFRGGAPNMKGLGMLVVLLKGVNSLF